jgi:hypothetical protein
MSRGPSKGAEAAPARDPDGSTGQDLEVQIQDLEHRLDHEIRRRQTVESSTAYHLGTRLLQVAEWPTWGVGAAGRLGRAALSGGVALLPERASVAAKVYLGKLVDRDAEAWVLVPPLISARRRVAARFPTVLFVALGLEDDDLERLVGRLVRMRQEGRGIRPLIVTNSVRFDLMRRYGLTFEYLPSADEYVRHHPERAYEGYLQRRMEQLMRAYRPDRVISVASEVITAGWMGAVVDFSER